MSNHRINTKRLAMTQFLGHWSSAFKGNGISFAESRPYQAGDPQNRIDRNTTAKKNELYVKEFEEERQLRFFCVVDCATSMQFRSSEQLPTKYEYATQVGTLFWEAAQSLGDQIGGVGFSDHMGTYCKPTQGMRGLFRWKESLSQTCIHADTHAIQTSSLERILSGLARLRQSHSIIVIVCDDMLTEPLPVLRGLAARNDLIVLHCFDPFEIDLDTADQPTRWGYFSSAGANRFALLTSDQKTHYKKQFEQQRAKTERFIRQAGADYRTLRTDRNLMIQLVEFFTFRKQYH